MRFKRLVESVGFFGEPYATKDKSDAARVCGFKSDIEVKHSFV